MTPNIHYFAYLCALCVSAFLLDDALEDEFRSLEEGLNPDLHHVFSSLIVYSGLYTMISTTLEVAVMYHNPTYVNNRYHFSEYGAFMTLLALFFDVCFLPFSDIIAKSEDKFKITTNLIIMTCFVLITTYSCYHIFQSRRSLTT